MISVQIGDGGDLTAEDFARLVQIVADANAAANLADKQLQRIETALDSALIAVENEAQPPDVPTDAQIVTWFAGMSRVNQLAAGMNPDGWAEAQTRAVPDWREEYTRRANIWRKYMLELADEGNRIEVESEEQ